MAKEQGVPDISIEEAERAFVPAQALRMGKVRDILVNLRQRPPQVLLLEGGTEEQRQSMARWWAGLMHCVKDGECCGVCPSCLHIGAGVHLDVFAFDGRISNKEDEENPGPVRAFNMENARDLKTRLGDSTHSGKRRIVILSGMDITRDAAANALLKVLEEPSPTTVFVLLAPQREQLLPTLVSRSWVLTLPWPDPASLDPALTPWAEALTMFLHRGQGWWQMTSGKGAVDQDMAQQVVLLCQKALMTALRGQGDSALCQYFMYLPPRQRMTAAVLLEEAHEALQYNVSPGRVLDVMAVRLFGLSH